MDQKHSKEMAPEAILHYLGIGIAAFIIIYLFFRFPSQRHSKLVGHPAPQFEFELPSGKKKVLSDYKGKTVLINFLGRLVRALSERNAQS